MCACVCVIACACAHMRHVGCVYACTLGGSTVYSARECVFPPAFEYLHLPVLGCVYAIYIYICYIYSQVLHALHGYLVCVDLHTHTHTHTHTHKHTHTCTLGVRRFFESINAFGCNAGAPAGACSSLCMLISVHVWCTFTIDHVIKGCGYMLLSSGERFAGTFL